MKYAPKDELHFNLNMYVCHVIYVDMFFATNPCDDALHDKLNRHRRALLTARHYSCRRLCKWALERDQA